MMFLKKTKLPKSTKKTAYTDFTKGCKGGIDVEIANDCFLLGDKLFASKLLTVFYQSEGIVFNGAAINNNIFLATDNGLFGKFNTNWVCVLQKVFNRPIFYHCSKQDVLLLTQYGKGTYRCGATCQQVCERGFSSLAMCKERVFGVWKDKVYYTEMDGISDWSNSVTLPGEAYALVEMGDCLWAVGKSIYKIDFDDDAVDSNVSVLYHNFANPQPRTIAVSGKKLFFADKYGIHGFYGGKVHDVPTNNNFSDLDDIFVAVMHNGMYYVVTTNRDGEVPDTVYTVDCSKMQVVEMKYMMTRGMFVHNDELYFASEDKLLCAGYEYNLFWSSKPIIFGDRFSDKYLRRLVIKADCAVTVTVFSNNERRIYNIDGSNNTQTVNIFGKCKNCTVRVTANTPARISYLALIADVYPEETSL